MEGGKRGGAFFAEVSFIPETFLCIIPFVFSSNCALDIFTPIYR